MDIKSFSKKYLYKYKFKILVIFFFCLIAWGINIGTTYVTGKYIDILVSATSIKSIYFFSIVLLILSISNIFVGYLNNIIFSKLQIGMVFDINFDVLQHVKKLPIKFFKNVDSVYLNQRINSDSNTIANFLISLFNQLTIQIIASFAVMYILLTKNLTFALIIVISLPIYLLLYFLFEKNLYKTTLDYKEEQNLLFSSMHKQLSNIPYIKLNSLFKTLDRELLNQYPRFFNSLKRYVKCSYYFGSVENFINSVFNVILFLYGGILIYKKQLTVGDFIIIKSYYGLLLNTATTLTNILKSYPDAKVSYNRIFDILNTDIEHNGNYVLNEISSIELKNVTLNFDDRNIIHKLCYKFEKGKVYLIKGNNGAGKSTLVKLILGLYIDEFDGEIKFNDINIKDIDLYNVRRNLISVMDQEPLLLHTDFYENITQGLEDVDKNLYNFINEMIYDINLKLERDSETDKVLTSNKDFSGGEKQKISFIRSIIKNPYVLVMDEPTSALDHTTTMHIIDKIKDFKHNKIILIISHDERLDCLADEIIKLENSTELELSV